VEYDLPEVISSRLHKEGEDETHPWGGDRLQEATEIYINKSNTVLDKDVLIAMAREVLK